MARRELGPAALEVTRAVGESWPGGEVVVGVSGGADSLALALGAATTARRAGGAVRAIVVDHGLQPESATTASAVVGLLAERGVLAEAVRVEVHPGHDGLEAAARDARLAALAAPGLPVLLGHTLDDQAEQVLLGLLRGSGTRSLAGMPAARGPFLRPLLGTRRATTVAACEEWGVTPWQDPMNFDPAFARVRARRALALLADQLGRDLAPNLARTALLARADADHLDELVTNLDTFGEGFAMDEGLPEYGPVLAVAGLEALPDALRWRALRRWLTACGARPTMTHVLAVDQLIVGWRGQGPIDVPGARVRRHEGELRLLG